MTGEEETEIK